MKDKNESFAHHAAKKIFLEWLRESAKHAVNEGASFCDIEWRVNRGSPEYGVFDEYPLTKDFTVVWDETEHVFEKGYPDYDWMAKNHGKGFRIADIAIQHKGMISHIIEIVHKNGLSEEKEDFYYSLPFQPTVYAIPSHWILSQVAKPTKMPLEFRLF